MSEMTTDEIIGWLQIFQLIATMFLLPAIYFFRKAYRIFTNMERDIKSVKNAVADLRDDLENHFVRKKTNGHSHIRRVK